MQSNFFNLMDIFALKVELKPSHMDVSVIRYKFTTVFAPVAQLDRVSGFEPGGREFESLRARHNNG